MTDGGLPERLAQASARVPFRLKVALVWAVIFVIMGFFFWIARFNTEWMIDKLPFIAKGLKNTILIALGGIVLAVGMACLGALGATSRNSVAYGVAGFYVSFFRGTPLIVQIFLLYLAMPQVGQNLRDQFPALSRGFEQAFVLDAMVAGILALGLNYGAYMTEIFRAGIQSVSGGQGEAAEALGMSYGQKMRKVVLPQAFRVSVPPVGNEFIAMMKDTALISFIGTTLDNAEVFRRATLAGKADFQNMEALIVAAGLYWALTAVFTFFQRKLESRLESGYVRSPDMAKAREATKKAQLGTGGHGGGGLGGDL